MRFVFHAVIIFAIIVFTAVYGKVGQLSYLYLGIGVLLFCLLVYRGAVAYRNRRAEELNPEN